MGRTTSSYYATNIAVYFGPLNFYPFQTRCGSYWITADGLANVEFRGLIEVPPKQRPTLTPELDPRDTPGCRAAVPILIYWSISKAKEAADVRFSTPSFG